MKKGLLKKLAHEIIEFYKIIPLQDVFDLWQIKNIINMLNTEFGVFVAYN